MLIVLVLKFQNVHYYIYSAISGRWGIDKVNLISFEEQRE